MATMITTTTIGNLAHPLKLGDGDYIAVGNTDLSAIRYSDLRDGLSGTYARQDNNYTNLSAGYATFAANATAASTATDAINASNDSAGNNIQSTYVKKVGISGDNIVIQGSEGNASRLYFYGGNINGTTETSLVNGALLALAGDKVDGTQYISQGEFVLRSAHVDQAGNKIYYDLFGTRAGVLSWSGPSAWGKGFALASLPNYGQWANYSAGTIVNGSHGWVRAVATGASSMPDGCSLTLIIKNGNNVLAYSQTAYGYGEYEAYSGGIQSILCPLPEGYKAEFAVEEWSDISLYYCPAFANNTI